LTLRLILVTWPLASFRLSAAVAKRARFLRRSLRPFFDSLTLTFAYLPLEGPKLFVPSVVLPLFSVSSPSQPSVA